MSGRPKRNSYFYKFLGNILLTLSVPALTILLLYAQAEMTVREQIMMASESTLNQFFRMVDASAKTMRETGITIAYHQGCETYAAYSVYQPERMYYQSCVLKTILHDFCDEKYQDIFVYFPDSDRIVSGRYAALTTERYYQTYYAGNEEANRESFYRVIDCQEKKPVFQTMEDRQGNPRLCVTMQRLSASNSQTNYVVVLVLDPEYMDLLMHVEEGDGGMVMMFDKDQKLLLSSAGEGIGCSMEGYPGTGAAYNARFGREDYVMQVKKSDVMDGYYVSAVPAAYFWRRLLQLRIICGIGALACVVISIVISYRSSRRSYQPIGHILNSLQSRSNLAYDEQMGNEFDYIEALFDREKEEKHILSQKLRDDRFVRQESFLLSLLEGAAVETGSGDDIFVKNGIELCSDRFCVEVMEVEEKNEMEGALLQFTIQNVFRELVNREQKGYVIAPSVNRYYILFNVREIADEAALEEIMAEGKEFLEEKYRILLTIGMGCIHEGMAGIRSSYGEASLAFRYRYLFGAGSVIGYATIQGREFRYPDSVESRLSSMVTGYVKGKMEHKSAEGFVAELLKQYGIDENASLETVEYFKLEAVNAMNRAIMASGYLSDNRRNVAKELLSRPTIETFHEYYAGILNLLRQKEQESAAQDDICRKAHLYIESHFAVPQLSVSMLGEELGISSSYLSKLFKEKYGMSILDCISMRRVQDAKRLLRDTKRSIQEIAEETGFLSSNVFIKTFKKWEGITPGVYRSLL